MLPVKICGVTRMEDAALAAELGANWVGFIFWPGSPRFVEPGAAGAILCKLPPHVSGVGVFVDQSVDEINSIADQLYLGEVRLHIYDVSHVPGVWALSSPLYCAASGWSGASCIACPSRAQQT